MKTAGFMTLVLLFTQSALAADIEVTVRTDKTSYSVGEDVTVFVTAFNPTDSEITLMFGSSCQATYHMDGWCDYMHDKGCLCVITGVVIGPNDSYTWTMVHDSDEQDYCPLYPGKHFVVGKVLSYGLSRSEPAEFEVVGEAPKIYVSTTGSDTTGDGSESNPFRTIQKGIDTAPYASIVVVKSGTYTGDGNRDISFNEKSIIVRSENGRQTCIIDCNGTADEPHRAFYFNYDQSRYAVLDGFTIANGYADRGGGIYCTYYSSPAIINCTISNNVAEEGAGIYCLESSATITNCVISGNLASCYGAGVYNYESNPRLINCTFSANRITATTLGYVLQGGGMYNYCSNPTLINCTFRANGMPLPIYNGMPLPIYSEGGGMYNDGSDPTLINCAFTGNSAVAGGGMHNWDNSNPTLINCVFSGNSAIWGGGFCNYYDNNPILINCTLTQNATYSGCGSGMFNVDCNSKLNNCIVWGNLDSEIFGPALITYSNIGGGWEGQSNIDADPCFVQPGYWDPNGTPEDANDDFWIDGDYHLLRNSPCIDTADNNSVPADTGDLDGDGDTTEPIPWDLEGNPRIVDGNNDGNCVVDMGAYEYFVPPIEVAMKFTPKALNPGSKGNWMKAHFVLPEEFAVEDVDANRPAVVEPGNIESDYMNVFINDDGLVEIEAAFDRREFCGIVTGGQPMEVRVTGSFISGQQFCGTDTIKITTNTFEYLAVLANYWLEEDCGKPDWCGGADIDQDSMVNFRDFGLFDGCCIEIITE